jgi:dienelactone hydrolase
MTAILLLTALLGVSDAQCAPAAAFTGTICTPAGGGTHPAVIVLGGSGGGDRLAPIARRFAEHGYVAASVAYFGAPGLPRTLDEIPVETVGNALNTIAWRDDVDGQRIALFGDSKGGELALLAASVYPTIHAVVALVPSPFAWSGANGGSSWTLGGRPVRYLALDRRRRDPYATALREHQATVGSLMFHLEDVRGPVLFLAGGDDAVWDSATQSELGLAYLRAHGHAYPDRSVRYPRAGHAFLFATEARPLTAFGGTARGNVEAGAAAWIEIDDFLTSAFARG